MPGESQPKADLDLLSDVVARALEAGADAADAVMFTGQSRSVSYRLGALEGINGSDAQDLGLRVFVGKKQAIASSSDFGRAAVAALIERAVAMAKAAPDDPYAGLAEPGSLASAPFADPDICDPVAPSDDALVEIARSAEDAARAVDGVTNSEGAGAGHSIATVSLATSAGFAGTYRSSSVSASATVLAGAGDAMERDYALSSARYLEDMEAAAVIGERAGRRAVARLGARKPASRQVPVLYDPRVGKSLLGHLAGAVNGQAIARGTSFLKDSMGEQIFADGVSMIDDPVRERGLRSKPFDGEGLAGPSLEIVEDGRLRSWVLDCAAARQLGLASNGRASRGTGGPPSPATTNLYMAPGTTSREALIGGVEAGFLVTELIGMGVNLVTGDYSRGAAGFWIEKGEIAYPVSEVTIAGNLKDMFRNLTPASDLEFRYGTNAPTLRIDGMMVAGS